MQKLMCATLRTEVVEKTRNGWGSSQRSLGRKNDDDEGLGKVRRPKSTEYHRKSCCCKLSYSSDCMQGQNRFRMNCTIMEK